MIGQLSKEEINRKLLHIVAVILPAGIFYGPEILNISRESACYIVFALLIISLLIEYFRFRYSKFGIFFMKSFGSMLRKEEQTKLTGASYILAGSLMCSLISLINDFAAVACFLCLTLFILGDAAAAIAGKAIGRMKIGDKTVEGGLACFLICILLSSFLFPELPFFLEFWNKEFTLSQVLTISICISLLEFFPFKIGSVCLNDNLYVPGLTSLIAMIIS